MAITYELSERAQHMGERLIKEHHGDLINCRIAYVMKKRESKSARTEAPKRRRGKRVVLARCCKCSASDSLLHGYDFKIIIEEREWDRLSIEQQEALIDHELCHAAYDPEKGEFYIRDHDLEEFRCIVKRHGLWKSDVEEFAEAIHQLKLFKAGEAGLRVH